MQTSHATLLGGSAALMLAKIYIFVGLVVVAMWNKQALPAPDFDVALAAATFSLWGLVAWAARNNIKLPPELVNGNGSSPTPPAEPAPQKT